MTTPEERSYERRLNYMLREYETTHQFIRDHDTRSLTRKGWCITLIIGYLGVTAPSDSGWSTTSFLPLYFTVLGFYMLEAFASDGRARLWTFSNEQLDVRLREPDQSAFEAQMAAYESYSDFRKKRKGTGWRGFWQKVYSCVKAAGRGEMPLYYMGLWLGLYFMEYVGARPNDWETGFVFFVLAVMLVNYLLERKGFWGKRNQQNKEQATRRDSSSESIAR